MQLTLFDIRRVLIEAVGAMRMLDVVQMKLILSKEQKIEEILTGVRIIKGVATVTQVAPVKRLGDGRRIMEILATVDPGDDDVLTYIDALARKLKELEDVVTIVIKTLNGQPVRDATGKRRLVY